MELKQYVQDAIRTESQTDTIIADPELLGAVMQIMIAAGNMLDQIKKNTFYGKKFDNNKLSERFMEIVVSLDQVKTAVTDGQNPAEVGFDPRIFHSIIGINTESVELLEALTQEDFDTVNFHEELGDLNWYQAIGIDATSGDFEQILDTNIKKLKFRYPEKFTSDKAINRDLTQERDILENKG